MTTQIDKVYNALKADLMEIDHEIVADYLINHLMVKMGEAGALELALRELEDGFFDYNA